MPTLAEVQQRAGTGTVLLIEEQTPPRPDVKPRSISLTGTGLPFKGAGWGGKQRVVTSWYSGNSEASQQVLGPQESPSQWSGMWRRTQLGRNPIVFTDENGVERRIVDPMRAREIIEDIGRAGARLRVTFYVRSVAFVGRAGTEDTKEFRIVREGTLSSWDFPIDTDTDIGWSLNFDWSGRGQANNAVVGSRDDETMEKTADALSSANEFTALAVDNKIKKLKGSKIPKTADVFTLGKLEQIANTPQALVTKLTRDLTRNVNQIKRVANVVQTVRAAPFTVANTIVNFARNTVSICNNTNDTLQRTPPEAQVLKQTVGSFVRSSRYIAEISETTREGARSGQDADDAVRKVVVTGANRGTISVRESSGTRAGDIIAVHVAKTGDTPQTVSMRYYRVPDQGAVILRSNRLPLHTPSFVRGKILIIPALTNAASQGTGA